MNELCSEIGKCTICKDKLDHEPRPVISVSSKSKIIIIGQAPGIRVHESGIPWNDASGKLLRTWLDVSDEEFYNPENFGIIPMGFCYPGTGKSGDLPPMKECAPIWHHRLFDKMPEVKLIILIGAYAQAYYLKTDKKKNLTEHVQNYEVYLPKYLALPHPSPRNRFWLKKNPWFEVNLIPVLQMKVQEILQS